MMLGNRSDTESTAPRPTGTWQSPLVPVSWGELVDKITILELKAERIQAPARRANVVRELAALVAIRDGAGQLAAAVQSLVDDLRAVNATLWDVEDRLREHETQELFDARFIELARLVYRTNDRRAALKRRINELTGSALVEEKSYAGAAELGACPEL